MINNLLFEVPILGAYLRHSGHICVKEGHGQEAIDAALRHLAAGHTVVIFPEGEISPSEGGSHQAKTGVSRLALASGAPVIPVGIGLIRENIYHIPSKVRGVEQIGHWYPKGPYAMTVGGPITFSGDADNREQTRSVADQIMRRINQLATESELRLNRKLSRIPGGIFGML
jgi:1-acyl-sn-glycerol-3-phosphate acyltransferase